MIELIFLDIDGTLIGASGQVADEVWQAVEQVRAQGITLSICTGRPGLGVAGRVAARVGPDTPHIFQSGSHVTYPDGRDLMAVGLREGDLERLVAFSKRTDAVLELYTPHGIFVSHLNEDCRAHAEALDISVQEGDLEKVAHEEVILKAHWIMRAHHVDEVLAVETPDSHVAVASSPVLPELTFASITRADVDKGTAARRVAGHLGIDLANAMAIGDSVGDLPIFEVVGHARVMGNSDRELLERFERLPSVEDHGVAHALSNLP